jgi:LysM repeat protein
MTATPEDPRPRRTAASSRASVPTTEPVREVCPYLESVDGGWRTLQPNRDHRCTATSPISPLSLAKQRELCLQPAHFGCATYLAAREIAAEGPAPADGGLWPETRSAVLSLDTVGRGRAGVSGLTGRGTGQALLIGLMVVAFIVLIVARVNPPVSGDPPASLDVGVTGSSAPGVSAASVMPASPTPVPTPTPAPSDSDAPARSTGPSGAPPSATPSGGPSDAPSSSPAGTSYRVRGGDTLSGIAARYGITVRALRTANGIPPGGVIHPGQLLVIPG